LLDSLLQEIYDEVKSKHKTEECTLPSNKDSPTTKTQNV